MESIIFVALSVLGLTILPQTVRAQALLENPQPASVQKGECGTKDGMLMDAQGQTVNAQVTNPCSREGESAEMLIFPFFSAEY